MMAQAFGGFFIALLSLLVFEINAVAAEVFGPASKKLEVAKIADTVPERVKESTDNCVPSCLIGNYCYNRSQLFELPGPFGTTVHIKKMGVLKMRFNKHVLFYSFSAPSDDAEMYKVGYVSIENPKKTSGVVPSKGAVPLNFSTFDINQRKQKVYLGSSKGIWVIDDPEKALDDVNNIVAIDEIVNNIISRDHLYYTKDNFEGIIVESSDKKPILEGNGISKFILDTKMIFNVVYLNRTGLYAFNSANNNEVKLDKSPYFRGLTVDTVGKVFAWHLDGIYQVHFNEVFSNSFLEQVSTFPVGDFAMTFDSDNNILYNEGKFLYKLTNTYNTDC